LGRPQSDGAVRDLREGIAIQMVLDTSGSMSESDFQLDGQWVRRLDAVKRVFRDFVVGAGGLPGRPSDLIGMTTFAMYADTRCPLTLDHANLVNLLAETEIPGWVGRDERYRHPEAEYTSLGDAIAVATDLLRRAGEQAAAGVAAAAPARSKVMILLTDGANNPPPEARDSSPDPVDAAELAGRLGIRVYTIGAIGSRPRGGSFAMPRAQADEPALRRIAEVTGGRYFRATDTASLVTIYEEIDQLERRTTGERTYRDNTRAARTAMLLGLGCLSAELLLVSTRFRRVP
jgi:Ca-activated chloride channel family protein